jgi:PadR family transcriptional regulator PadR
MSVRGASQIIPFSSCPCVGKTLDKLIQPAILAVLGKGPLHGYKIAERIGEMPMLKGQKPDVSGVYRFLKSMEAKRLVVSSWDCSQRGPARKSYRLTGIGEQCLARWIQTLEEHRKAVTALLKTSRAALAGKRRRGLAARRRVSKPAEIDRCLYPTD